MRETMLIPGMLLLFLMLTVGCAEKSDDSVKTDAEVSEGDTHKEKGESPGYLLTLASQSGTWAESGELTLSGLDPDAIYFSERPGRRAGKLAMADFMKVWSDSANAPSFETDPPNALLSVIDSDGKSRISVVELTDVDLSGSTARFSASLHEGIIPPSFGAATLVIDAAGSVIWSENIILEAKGE